MKIIDRENCQYFELPSCFILLQCKYEIDKIDTDYLIYNYFLVINSGKFEVKIASKRLKNHQENTFRKTLTNSIFSELVETSVLDLDEIRREFFKKKGFEDE